MDIAIVYKVTEIRSALGALQGKRFTYIKSGSMRTAFSSSHALFDINGLTLCRKYYKTKGPEARLYSACFAAVLFPAGMFIYAWCTFPTVPWIGMAMGVFVSPVLQTATIVTAAQSQPLYWQVIMTALFVIYVAVFTYLADWCVAILV